MQLNYGGNDDSAFDHNTAASKYTNQFAMERLEAHPEQLRFRLQFARHLIENGDMESGA